MRANRYMAMSLGCYDCDLDAYVIGFYSQRQQAETAIVECGGLTGLTIPHWGIYDVHDAIGFAEFQDVAS